MLMVADKTLKWEIAQITKVENTFSELKILDKNNTGKILFKNLKWTGKKTFKELFPIEFDQIVEGAQGPLFGKAMDRVR